MLFFLDLWFKIKNKFKPSPYRFERKLLARRGIKTIGVHSLGENKYVSIDSDKISYYFLISNSNNIPIRKHKWNNTGPTFVGKYSGVEYNWTYGHTGDYNDITSTVVLWAESRGMDWERLTETDRLQYSIEFSPLSKK